MGGYTLSDFFNAVTEFSHRDPTLRATVIGVIAFLGALWIGLIVWTARDVSARTTNGFARFVAVVVVFALHLFGFFLYLLFRPARTLAERDEIAFEHDLLRQASQQPESTAVERTCDTCGTVLGESFKFCPQCRTQIRRACKKCEALLELAWKNCPFCGSSAETKKSAK